MLLSWNYFENVGAILERATELSGVDGQLKRDLVVAWFSK
jgi:hypothetical protein